MQGSPVPEIHFPAFIRDALTKDTTGIQIRAKHHLNIPKNN